jgi:hypothetical protein
MRVITSPDTAEFPPSDELRPDPRPQERYEDLDFAHRVRLPVLAEAADEFDERNFPPPATVHSLVRRMNHVAMGLFAAAVAAASLGHRTLLGIAIGFGGVAVYAFANYTADRLGDSSWRIPAVIALQLAIAASFLAATAFLAALTH